VLDKSLAEKEGKCPNPNATKKILYKTSNCESFPNSVGIVPVTVLEV
jgi:hypothetical protein